MPSLSKRRVVGRDGPVLYIGIEKQESADSDMPLLAKRIGW
jgi:hypothetical protein